jgi:nitroreductase
MTRHLKKLSIQHLVLSTIVILLLAACSGTPAPTATAQASPVPSLTTTVETSDVQAAVNGTVTALAAQQALSTLDTPNPSFVPAFTLTPTEAPLVIAVVSSLKQHPKVPAWEQELSAGASCMNIVAAATALGYGANWLTGWFAFDRDVLDGLGLKADEKLAGFIHIGTPSKPAEDRPRPALSDIVTRF